MKKLKPYLLSIGGIAVAVLLFYFLGEFIIPFIIGLLGAYFASGHIRKLQKLIPNRNLAVTTYLVLTIAVGIGILVLFGAQLVNDIQRLNSAFSTFTKGHQQEIDGASEEVRSYIEMIYSSEEVQEKLNSLNLDSLSNTENLDSSNTAILTDALTNITSFLGQGNEDPPEKEQSRGINWLVVFFSSIGYFIYIIYTFPYFERKFEKYFGNAREIRGGLGEFILDFKRIFLDYFKRRTWIVLICSGIFITTFLILSIPGAIILGLLAGSSAILPISITWPYSLSRSVPGWFPLSIARVFSSISGS